MKESIWAWWFIVLGLIIMAVIVLVTDMTTTNEQDYYMIKSKINPYITGQGYQQGKNINRARISIAQGYQGTS